MILDHNSSKPIYVQISEWLETEIINGNIEENEKMYSQYQLADKFNVNPATAAKGLTLLVDSDILYKKRGLGMFVKEKAKEKIIEKRKSENLRSIVNDLVREAEYLQVSNDEILKLIEQVREEGRDS
ncbi:GntR family transcriptional regulator [Bacillaceae bacterium W0354]